MARPIAQDITELLQASKSGDADAAAAVYGLVYQELRVLARAQRRRWVGNETLNTTALIHEAFLKLAGSNAITWNDRSHFFGTASRAMRQILINYAKQQLAAKRGGDNKRVPLEDNLPLDQTTAEQLINLHQALDALESDHPRRCRIVECRVFGGLGNDEIAEALDISRSTVKRDWTLATTWLYQHMGQEL